MRSLHSLQSPDNLPNLSGKHLQGGDYFELLGRCSLSERYLESDLSVILELSLKSDSATVCTPKPRSIESREANVEGVNRPVFVLQCNANNSSGGNHGYKEAMFVVNVEVVEGQDIAVPSLVTLNMIDHEVKDAGSRIYASIFEGSFKPISGLIGPDGKVSPASRPVSNNADDIDPCNIKSGAEIVNCISSNQCEVGLQVAIFQSVVKELFPRLSVHVKPGSVTVGRGKESLLEICDVLIGPFDL